MDYPSELFTGPGGGCPWMDLMLPASPSSQAAPAGVPRSEAKSEQWLHGHGEQAGGLLKFHCRLSEKPMFFSAGRPTMSWMAWVLSAETLTASSPRLRMCGCSLTRSKPLLSWDGRGLRSRVPTNAEEEGDSGPAGSQEGVRSPEQTVQQTYREGAELGRSSWS